MNIYEYRDNYYCGDCVVSVLTDDERYTAWANLHEVQMEDPEGDLDSIAHDYGINRADPEDIRVNNFPVLLDAEPEPPSMCAECLHWFS